MIDFILGTTTVLAVGAAILIGRKARAHRTRLADLQREHEAMKERFAPVLDLEEEAARVRTGLEAKRHALEKEALERRAVAEAEIESARKSLDDARAGMEKDAAATRARLEAEAARVRVETELARQAVVQREVEAGARQEALASAYRKAKEVFDRLTHELSLLEENLEDISFGIYKPHYDFATSREYKDRLEKVWLEQKAIVKKGGHVHYGVAWTIGDSRSEGERMQKQYGKLLLRAFNGECDACIAKVAWNNAPKMEERIRKGFESINQLGGVMRISITPEYRELRLQELRLHHEMEEKKRAEFEEQRRLRAQLKEEEKAQRELDRAREEAEEEEREHERSLEKARKELASARGAELAEMSEKVKRLEQELEEAHRTKERAISRAQMTRSGHVYVISNPGSFGEDVVKIGMTRRLEPRERVKELGDASVPFEFDIHGLIFSEDAPGLENELHRRFQDRRLNLVNERKEFFRVPLREIEDFLRQKELRIEFAPMAEAREYRETLARLQKRKEDAMAAEAPPSAASSAFPGNLFGEAS